MNDNLVVSAVVAADLSAKKEGVRVKLTSTGINLAAAADVAIGTLRRPNNVPANGQSAVGMACAVELYGHIHDVRLGATSAAIAMGAEIVPDPDASNPGYFAPGTGAGTMFAWQAVTGFHNAILSVVHISRDIAV